MIWKNLILVGFGGMLGSILRYGTGLLIKQDGFPAATLAVNILGSFVIGCVMAMTIKQDSFADWRLFAATGICGGFTTFSAFSWESLQMVQQQRYAAAAFYVSISLIAGIAATFFGYWLIKQ
jgi:CrcB protein